MFLNLRHSIQQQFVGPTGQHTHMHIDLHMYIAHWILHIAYCILHMAYVRQPPPFLQAPISRQQSHLEHSGVGQSWGDLPSSVVGLDLNIFLKSKLSGETLSLRFFVDNQTRGECG